MSGARTPAEVLLQARRRDSQRKRAQVKTVVDQMKLGDAPITFSAVAKAAGVSTWLVYADGIRDYIQAAQAFQASAPARETAVGARTSAASLRIDLELSRQNNRVLRAEIARLKHALRDNLGRQLDAESTHHLRARVDELTAANEQIQNENRALTGERDALQAALHAAEEDLAAARTSLRRMIREQTNQLTR
jgi:hypothetical protein